MMGRMLSDADIRRFGEDGVVAVRGAFSREAAAAAVEVLTRQLGPVDDGPVQRVLASVDPAVVATANTTRLTDAFDRVVGPGAWSPIRGMGSFVARFPSEADPGDAGWHCDGGFLRDGGYWLNARSEGRALLVLLLYTDVGPDDAPTRLRLGSHRVVAPILEPYGERGVDPFTFAAAAVPATDGCPVALATGSAGDAYLCHPFLVHAASWPHRGSGPRWIAQQALPPTPAFDVSALGCR